MGYVQPPLFPPPPPPPPPPPHQSRNTMPMLYYGLVILATAGVVLAMYNLIVIKWCSHHRPAAGRRRPARFAELMATDSRGGFNDSNRRINLLSSFEYKKGALVPEKGGGNDGNERDEFECAVCLSVFEEGEEVRQLPRCMHCFHVGCIDMWLYSHFDCPLCRSPVNPPPLSQLRAMTGSYSEHSQEGLLAMGMLPV